VSDKPVYIAAALGVGAMLGIPLGAITAANILPVTVGDGWANIGGAAVGVLGAFFVANWNFTRSLKAQEDRLLRPIQKRFEYCDKYLAKTASLAIQHSKLQRTLLEDIQKIVDNPEVWHPINRPLLANYSPLEATAIKIVVRSNDYPLSEFGEIFRLTDRTTAELTWLREQKREDLSPLELEIEFIGTLIEDIDRLNKAAGNSFDVLRDLQSIKAKGQPFPLIHMLPGAISRTERLAIKHANSALSQIKKLRAVH